MLPNFIGVGTQRAGTTWLYNCLKQHPDIYMSTPKELHFFYVHYENGIEWYKDKFSGVTNESVVGEITPDYMYHEEAIRNIKKHIPNAKLIIVLRDPIERAISAYKLHYKHSSGVSFETACESNKDLIDRGRYVKYLDMVQSYFPSNQLKIMIYEDIKVKPESFLDEIYEYLGVQTGFRPSIITKNYNKIIYPKTQKFLQNMNLNWMIEGVKTTPLGDWLRKRQTNAKDNISEYARRHLSSTYVNDTKKLIENYNLDIHAWKSHL